MERRNFIRIVGGHAVAAAAAACAGCTQSMPRSAIAAWQGPEPQEDVRRWILAYAILAPHSHNMQSWVVDLATPGEILLRCDLDRLLPETDPYSRQIMMSHGTFLELLSMAAGECGLRAETTLFPEGAFGNRIDQRPVARIRLVRDPTVQRDPLFKQILARRTNRSVYDSDRPVPMNAWLAMADAAVATEHGLLRFGFTEGNQPHLLAQHRSIAAQAWQIELTTPRTVMESYKVLRVGAAEIEAHPDGLYVLDPMVVLLDRIGMFDRSSAPSPNAYATTSQIKDFDKKLASTLGFLWMVTRGNDRISQVNSGRAYVRVQLAATAHGLAMQPLQQSLQEYPEQAEPNARIRLLLGASPQETIQMWARVGFAPAVDPAPRRGVQAQLLHHN
jgi:hypothetical protein